MNNADRKLLASRLHTANAFVVDARLTTDPVEQARLAFAASDLIKAVIDELMDAPEMTDYYGNPTHRDATDNDDNENYRPTGMG